MPEEERLFYTIGEAAQIVDVKPYVLRYWESEFRKLNPQKSETGQRTYRKKDLQIALAIKQLLYDEKYTIAGALVKLEEMEKEGLDQIDLFGDRQNSPNPTSAAPNPDQAAPPTALAPEPLINRPSVALPTPRPLEKVRELKNLIAKTQGILKKYQMT